MERSIVETERLIVRTREPGEVEALAALWRDPIATIEKARGRVLGHCGLRDKDVAGRPEVELVYLIAPSAWGGNTPPKRDGRSGIMRWRACRRSGLSRSFIRRIKKSFLFISDLDISLPDRFRVIRGGASPDFDQCGGQGIIAS